MRVGDRYDVAAIKIDDGCTILRVRAGRRGVEHIVPPAGEEYAFDRELWEREVEIYVSPKGRSVRVFVDGDEVKKS